MEFTEPSTNGPCSMAMLNNQMVYIVATKYNMTHKHRNYTHTQVYMNVHACVHTTITGNYNNNITNKIKSIYIYIYLITVTTNTNSNKHYIYMYIIVCICVYICVCECPRFQSGSYTIAFFDHGM